ncbi:MAG: hypothetical protein N2D54_03855, partial [Chloroflexota bacterium]
MKNLRNLTLGNLLIAITFIAVIIIAIHQPFDTDTFWHLRAGEWEWQNRAMLRTDLFSHTHMGEEWINHGWPLQVILFLLNQSLGGLGLILYVVGLAIAGLYFIYLTCEGDEFVKAVAIALTAMAATIFWTPRPLMISFTLSGLIYYLIWAYQRKDKNTLWLIPPLMLIWVNLHGAGVNGFIILVLAAVGEGFHWLFEDALPAWKENNSLAKLPRPIKTTQLILAGLLSAALSALNPYGIRMLQYPFFTFNMEASRKFIAEWQSPDFHVAQTLPFLWLLLGTFLIVGLSSKKLGGRNAIFIGGTAYAALNSTRIIPTFAIVAAPVFAAHLSTWLQDLGFELNWQRPATRMQSILNWVIVFALILVVLGQLGAALDPELFEEAYTERVPRDAAAYLQKEQLPGKLFNSYNWGGYLIWQARDYPVYIDSRADL